MERWVQHQTASSSVRVMWAPDWLELEVERRGSGWGRVELWWEASGVPWLGPGTGPGWLCAAAPPLSRNVNLLLWILTEPEFEWQQRASWLLARLRPAVYLTINKLITLIEPVILWYTISIFNIKFENLIKIVKNKRYLSRLSVLPLSCVWSLMFCKINNFIMANNG